MLSKNGLEPFTFFFSFYDRSDMKSARTGKIMLKWAGCGIYARGVVVVKPKRAEGLRNSLFERVGRGD